MGLLTGRIAREGALVPVTVMATPQRVTALKRQGLAFPGPSTILGLLDTGASCSAVDRSILRGLGLEPTGSTSIHTPSTGPGGVAWDQYDVSLTLGTDTDRPLHLVIPVIDAELAAQGITALIGRDVLAYCELTYYGGRAEFELRF